MRLAGLLIALIHFNAAATTSLPQKAPCNSILKVKSIYKKGLEISVTNIGLQPVTVANPFSNRMSLQVILSDKENNIIPPEGLAKIDPAKSSKNILPGKSITFTAPPKSPYYFSFITGTALWGYRTNKPLQATSAIISYNPLLPKEAASCRYLSYMTELNLVPQ